MKRFFAVVVFALIILQLCLYPAEASAVDPFTPSPSVVTLPVTNITNNSATLNGIVTIPLIPVSLQYVVEDVMVSFRYGTVPGIYPFSTTAVPTDVSGTFSANISGLSACSIYYVQARVTSIPPAMFNTFSDGLKGAGAGLDYKNLQHLFFSARTESFGAVMTFQTTGCLVGAGAVGGSSFSGTTTTTTPPVVNPVILTQSASLSSKAVTPGTPVTVTADIINKSAVNGSKKVTLYVNGQVESTQGITVNSGGSTKLTFNVSRSEPGDYNVYVDGVPAGSFKVEIVSAPDTILIFSAVLVAVAFVVGMVMLWRRQRAIPS